MWSTIIILGGIGVLALLYIALKLKKDIKKDDCGGCGGCSGGVCGGGSCVGCSRNDCSDRK